MEVSRNGQGGQIQPDSLSFNGQSKAEGVKKDAEPKSVNAKQEEYKAEDIKKAVEKLNKFLEDNDTYVEYSVHEKFKDVMIKIIDKNTKEVIREVPPKKILDMVARMCELVGVLIDKKA